MGMPMNRLEHYMKIRFHNNSVRVRLTQTEVARLGAGNRLEHITTFSPGARFFCSIEPSDQAQIANVTFRDGSLLVMLPKMQTAHWATSDHVGIESRNPVCDSESLHLLVEKDFACLHSAGEQTPDAFPNPLA